MRKTNPILAVTAIALASATTGCQSVADVVLPTTVTVTLTNTSNEFNVEVNLFYSNEQDMPDFLLREVGENVAQTIPPGESVTIQPNCEDLQAIMIDDANLIVVGGTGPDGNTDVLRDGENFNCGDTIQFTFTHTDAVVDFEVITAVQ